MAKTGDYVQALRELEQMRSEGRIDQAAYEVHKANLLNEQRRGQSPAYKLVRWIGIAVVVAVVLLVVVSFLGAM